MSLIPFMTKIKRGGSPPQPIGDLTYLIIGQSNAGNREFTVNIDGTAYDGLIGLYSNINYEDNNQYPSRQVYDRPSGLNLFGADLGINSVIKDNYTSIEIVKYFLGSQPIQYFLDTYQTNIYKGDGTAFIESRLNAQSKVPDVIVWIQGEEDANVNNTNYLTQLNQLASQLRTDFNPNLKFILNQLYFDYFNGGKPLGTATIRDAQATFAAQDVKNVMINMDDVANALSDGAHFTPTALAELGIRFGNQI